MSIWKIISILVFWQDVNKWFALSFTFYEAWFMSNLLACNIPDAKVKAVLVQNVISVIVCRISLGVSILCVQKEESLAPAACQGQTNPCYGTIMSIEERSTEANKNGGQDSYSFCQHQRRRCHWSQLPKRGGDTGLLKRGDWAERALRGRRGVELLLCKGGRTAEIVLK